MPLNISDLPKVTFVERGGSRVLDLARCGPRIASLSDAIQAKFPNTSRLGILFTSSEELVLYWLAALECRKVPLILQYPTRKLSNEYWLSTLNSTIGTLDLGGIICGPEISERVAGLTNTLVHDGGSQAATRSCETISPRSVLQMSSGTTGMRKGIEFTWDALETHIRAYDRVMRLTADDCIVSWLPLYHDMGFIAAFAMPLVLGVPIAMIDPITWVEDRELLFHAVCEHRGTICYMPNFGFEVMSRHPCSPVDLASMRLWVSCSEPTYRASLERFCSATGTAADRVAVCYAMAENIFAITQRPGINVCLRDDQEIVSCGAPLPDTDIKIIDGQIWVRSPCSISSYVGGEDILVAEGFYATGDMGFVDDGELFIEGRRHDLLVQAGRKFFLNDFDYLLNQFDPTCRGRGASLAIRDERIGTEKLVILVERDDFLDAKQRAALQAGLSGILPVEDFELQFVPPDFITKTSSGKVNRRKTAEDFKLIGQWRNNAGHQRDLPTRLEELFPLRDKQRPIREIADSLGLVLADLLAQESGVAFDADQSMEDLVTAYKNSRPEPINADQEVIALVSMIDEASPGFALTDDDLDQLSESLGVSVTFEHVCLPPAYFVWQDIVFRDYFLPRDASEKYVPLLQALGKLDRASVLLFDDFTEFNLGVCAFPLLDRKFRRAPIADLLALRFQQYGLQHHELPIGDLRLGASVTRAQREDAFRNLSAYFRVPLFRATYLEAFAAETTAWEQVDFRSASIEDRHQRFVASLTSFLRDKLTELPLRQPTQAARRRVGDDLAHFCSFVVNPRVVELTIARFDTFIIQGLPNSLPYLTKRLEESGKRFLYVPTLNPGGTVGPLDIDPRNACVLQTGAWRECVTDLPVVRLMHGDGADMKNLPPDLVFPPGLNGEVDLIHANYTRYVTNQAALDSLRHLAREDYALLSNSWMNVGREPITASVPWPDKSSADDVVGFWRGCLKAWRHYEADKFAEGKAGFEHVRRDAYQQHGASWVNASRGLLLCSWHLQMPDLARDVAEELLEWAPPHTSSDWQEIYFITANSEVALGRPDKAIPFLDKILAVNPGHEYVAQMRATCSKVSASAWDTRYRSLMQWLRWPRGRASLNL